MLGEDDSPSYIADAPVKTASQAASRTYSRNVVSSLVRVGVNALIALVLPAYLTHKLSVKVYGAWVLILQLSAYVSYLDFGVQTAVSKYVAEYDAKGDGDGVEDRVSVGFSIMLITSLIGILLILVLVWRVPHLFHEMPSYLYRDVRIGLTLVGISLAIMLTSSVFAAIFLGLQRYSVPVTISIINKVLFTVVICSAVFFQANLAIMGAGAALVNVSTAFLQIAAWRKWARQVRVSLFKVTRTVLKEMLGYCGVLAIWQAGMLCITGLDVAIVGHYDFNETAYYSIATLPTNLILAIMVAAVSPLMPAASALSTQCNATEMGKILARITRYSTTLLLVSGLPLMVCGFYALRYWVGADYALHSMPYLRILVLANIVRNLCLPYANMVVATGKQKAATVSAVSEAVVNIVSSIYLAGRMGAIGVAFGTLLGAFVGVSLHFILSMQNTRNTLEISRVKFFLDGIARPAMIAVPSILLSSLWWSSTSPFLGLRLSAIWGLSTLLLAWFGGLSVTERRGMVRIAKSRLV